MKPFYEREGVTLYCGDCREILPTLAIHDLLLTDPPYGIGEGKKAARRTQAARPDARWTGRVCTDYAAGEWDAQIEQELIDSARKYALWQIIFGGNYYSLPPTSCWLIWDKINGDSDFADCEMAWTNLPKAVRRINYLWNGFQKAKPEPRFHPTQKPLAVIEWAIHQAPAAVRTVLDPFTGSGTTGVACIRTGRQFIGIELEERYCQVAAERFEKEFNQGQLFEPAAIEPRQLAMEAL